MLDKEIGQNDFPFYFTLNFGQKINFYMGMKTIFDFSSIKSWTELFQT